MPDQTGNRERLGDLMEARRIELGLRWSEVATTGGPAYETLRAIRAGTAAIRPLTKRGIEIGLRWEQGSVDAILAGRDPVPLNAAAPRPAARYDDSRMQRVSDVVAGLDADQELKDGMLAFADAWYRQHDTPAGAGRRGGTG